MSRTTKLQEIRNYVDTLLFKSPTKREGKINFAVLGDRDGDACLFNGLLSTVGVSMGTYGVLSSQAQPGEPKAGMFYRSPRRRACDNIGFGPHFFSRDMSLGVLCAYSSAASHALKTEFAISASRWIDWINGNRTCAVEKPWPFKGCLVRGPYRFAPDDRSDITPAMWAMMGRVWEHNGWRIHREMKRWAGSDGDVSVIEAKGCDLGYQLHLKAVQAYIKFLINQSREFSQKVGDIAHERIPENLFYEFVAKRKITDSMIDRFLDMKPPLYQNWGHSWLWEKSEVTEERIKKSCGWDFLFMGELLLRYS